jgi:hypothetical protein
MTINNQSCRWGVLSTTLFRFFGLLILSACATGTPNAADIGPVPTIDPDQEVKSRLELILIDSDSAKYRRVGGPVPGRAQQALLLGGQVVEGWGYCYLINAKNRLGGYTGYTPYYFVFRNNTIVGGAQNSELSSWNCF